MVRSLWILLALAAGAAQASLDVTLSGLADDDGGYNMDGFVSWAPNDYLSLSAGLGQSDSSSSFSSFSGTSYQGSIDLHNARFGGRLSYRRWQDSGDFASESTAGRLYWRRGGFEAAVLLEQRDMSVSYTFVPMGLTRPITQQAQFGGDGLGLALSWYGDTWGGYVQYLDLDFNDRLLNTLSSLLAVNPERVPALSALAASVFTKASGVTDHEFSVGIDRTFARSGLRVDAYQLRDLLSRSDSLGLSVSYRYSLTPRLQLEGTLGGTDSEGFDTLYYGGLSVTIRN